MRKREYANLILVQNTTSKPSQVVRDLLAKFEAQNNIFVLYCV